MALEQLSFDFGSVVCTEIVRSHPDAPQIKTVILGELPNNCGVYVCPPDEVLEWKNKRDSLTIGLLRLENNQFIYSFKFFVGNSGMSFGYSCADEFFCSREQAVQGALNTLHNSWIFKDELSEPLKKSLGKFIDELV